MLVNSICIEGGIKLQLAVNAVIKQGFEILEQSSTRELENLGDVLILEG